MDGADRLDAVFVVPGQHVVDGAGIGAAPPVRLQRRDIQAEAPRHLLPQMRKLSGAADQDAVAGGQRVDQRRLPGAGAGGGEDADDAGGLEDVAQPGDHLPPQRAEFRAAVVDRVAVHCPHDPLGQVCRPRGLQKMTAGHELGHGRRILQGRVRSMAGHGLQ